MARPQRFPVKLTEITKLRLVSTEPTPDKLFVCSAKIKPEAGIALKSAFEAGIGLPGELEATYNEHLVYVYDLGERGLYLEAGPAVDFAEVLYIFSTDILEEAQRLMQNDPFYKAGMFYDDRYFDFQVYLPPWRSQLPMPADGPEEKVEVTTPLKLIVSFARVTEEPLEAWLSGKAARPAFQIQHLINVSGPAGIVAMGYDWLSGPLSESSTGETWDLTILSVNSMLMAQLIRENDAFSRYGVFHDFRYFEWCIHMPFRKASPQHKEALKRFLRGAGVKLAEE